jgi:hypothetical protein
MRVGGAIMFFSKASVFLIGVVESDGEHQVVALALRVCLEVMIA